VVTNKSRLFKHYYQKKGGEINMPNKDGTGPKGHGPKDGHGKGKGQGQGQGQGTGQGAMTGGKEGIEKTNKK
jgi:hypothetical protein